MSTTMDEQEIELIRGSVRGVLTETDTSPLPERLRALGWNELRAEEPAVAVGVLFEEHGRALATSRALDEIVAQALGIDLGTDVMVAHPSLVQVDRAPLHGDRLDGLVLGALPSGADVIAIASADETTTSSTIAATDLTAIPIEGFDPTLGIVAVTGPIPDRASTDRPNAGVSGAAVSRPWTDAVDAARRALAHELVGVAEGALALAVAYVTEREQFGHPIAAFQSVRHRLADDYVAITAAKSAIAASWLEPGSFACTAAKALAGRAALLTTRDAQQLCGAIGFTWEHPLHLFLRRAWMLDALYGTAVEMERRIGAELIQTGHVPRVLPLG